MRISIDNRVCDLRKIPKAVAIVEEVIPGFWEEPRHPRMENFSLRFLLTRGGQKNGAKIRVLDAQFEKAAIDTPERDGEGWNKRNDFQPNPAGWRAAEGATAPNFVFINIDDMGWRDLGCAGSSFYETPVIDQLCDEGMFFGNAYASCPVCSPSRASLLTGKYPARLGITDWIDDTGKFQPLKGKLIDAENATYISEEEFTLAQALKEAGYQTWHVGKWHLGSEAHDPIKYGFDVNIGGCSWGLPKQGYFSPYGIPTLTEGPAGEYLTDRLTDEAIALIRNRDKNQPFFLNLSHYTVHAPMDAKKEDIDRFARKASEMGLDQLDPWVRGSAMPTEGKEGQYILRRIIQSDPVYAAMIWNLDWNIGRLLDCLAEAEIYDNTVIIFTSDNGGLATAEGSPTCNLPAIEGKGWAYEGGIRVPLLIRFPSKVKPHSRCDTPVITTDFYPTILELAGLALRPEQHMDGISLAPLFTGRPVQERPLFWHYPHYGNQGGTPCAAVRMGEWKLMEFFEDGHRELYNLTADFSEQNDLVREYPEKEEELSQLLHTFLEAVNAKMPEVNPQWCMERGQGI